MAATSYIVSLLLLLSTSVLSTTVDVTYSQAGSTSKPRNLATILYDATSLQASIPSWTPPALSDKTLASSRLLSIHVPDGGASLTTLSTFNRTLQQVITLHIDVHGNAYSVAISTLDPRSFPEPAQNLQSRGRKQGTKPKVVVQPPTPGPTVTLNHRKPVKIDESGKEIPTPDQEREKTFLQKYWWVFLIVTILALGGGGDK